MQIQFDLKLQKHVADDLEKKGGLKKQVVFKAAEKIKNFIIDKAIINEDTEASNDTERAFNCRMLVICQQETIDKMNAILMRVKPLDESIFDDFVDLLKTQL